MPVTLPLEVFEAFEKTLGRENAKIIVKSLETTISEATEYKWKVTKDELLDAMRKEFVTRELFDERLNTLRAELLGKIEHDKTELLGKIEAMRITLDRKFTVMFLILLFAIIFLNQNALQFILSILGLLK